MAKDNLSLSEKISVEVVKTEAPKVEAPKVEPIKTESLKTIIPKAAPVHILTLPITTINTDLIVDDLTMTMPAGQPTVAIEAHFPFKVTYGNITRTFEGRDPFVPKSINLQ